MRNKLKLVKVVENEFLMDRIAGVFMFAFLMFFFGWISALPSDYVKLIDNKHIWKFVWFPIAEIVLFIIIYFAQRKVYWENEK